MSRQIFSKAGTPPVDERAMTVRELASALSVMPPDAPVWMYWESSARTCIVHVWATADGRVIVADEQETICDDADRPVDAPLVREETYWETPRVSALDEWGKE